MADLREARHGELYNNASIIEASSFPSFSPGGMGATCYIRQPFSPRDGIICVRCGRIAPLNWFEMFHDSMELFMGCRSPPYTSSTSIDLLPPGRHRHLGYTSKYCTRGFVFTLYTLSSPG